MCKFGNNCSMGAEENSTVKINHVLDTGTGMKKPGDNPEVTKPTHYGLRSVEFSWTLQPWDLLHCVQLSAAMVQEFCDDLRLCVVHVIWILLGVKCSSRRFRRLLRKTSVTRASCPFMAISEAVRMKTQILCRPQEVKVPGM